MKRTGEITLGVIGVISSVLMSLVGMLFIIGSNSSDAKMVVEEQIANDANIDLQPGDLELMMSGFTGYGWALAAAAIIGLVFGLIAVVSIKGNKKPKLAGWMFIIGAVLTGIISIGFGFVPAILYLIAGIMAFARKAPIETQEPPAI